MNSVYDYAASVAQRASRDGTRKRFHNPPRADRGFINSLRHQRRTPCGNHQVSIFPLIPKPPGETSHHRAVL